LAPGSRSHEIKRKIAAWNWLTSRFARHTWPQPFADDVSPVAGLSSNLRSNRISLGAKAFQNNLDFLAELSIVRRIVLQVGILPSGDEIARGGGRFEQE
jgi:hypothetical protein